jgi:uncharacterized protein (TIGR02271 family)
MASTQTPGNDLRTSEARVIAFFRNKNDAYSAINQLRAAGFTSSEIGLMAGSEYESTGTTATTTQGKDHDSFWQKVKDFFTGEHDEDYDYRETSSDLNWTDDRADYYYQGINAGGALVSVTGTRREEARRILQDAGGDLRESGFESSAISSGASADVEGDRRIQLRGEILRTYKDRVQRGEVRLRKDVITEKKNVEVPVTREELVIERTPVSGQSATGEIGKDQEIRVPLSEERVRTEKQPVVTDEVRVGKRAVQRTENVADDVRHEELRVDKDGDVDVDTQATPKRKKPAA